MPVHPEHCRYRGQIEAVKRGPLLPLSNAVEKALQICFNGRDSVEQAVYCRLKGTVSFA